MAFPGTRGLRQFLSVAWWCSGVRAEIAFGGELRNFRLNAMIRGPVWRCILIFSISIIIGCDGLSFPWPGDKQALKDSCRLALKTCRMRCKGNYDCTSACDAGSRACIIHIDEEQPHDWQPADAFYDGCVHRCRHEPCSSACSAGQTTAAADLTARLRKYGTITR